MTYLANVNVLSEPTKPQADALVVQWLLRDDVRRRGFTVPVKDTLIAAAATFRGLTVATRNVDDFRRCGVPVVNPFE